MVDRRIRLHPDDIRAIAAEVARQLRSGEPSASGITEQPEARCDESESSSLERMAREDIAALRSGRPLRPQPRTRRKGVAPADAGGSIEVVRVPRPGVRERLVDLLVELLNERRRNF